MDEFRSQEDALAEAKRFAASPEANPFKALLQQPNAQGLRAAMEQAAGGDLQGAKATIEAYLTTPEGKQLLDQLRKNP